MPVFRNLRKWLIFRAIQKFSSDFRLIFENPSHFSAIFGLKNMKISLRNFRISLLDSRITLSNPKISLSDFRRVKIFAKIPQFCVHFCQKSRVKTFYFFVKILYQDPVPENNACLYSKDENGAKNLSQNFLSNFDRERFFYETSTTPHTAI